MLEREARGERRLGDLQLRLVRLRGRDAVLQLVAGLRQRLRDGILLIAQALGRLRREDVADRRRQDERPDQVAAAALVLLRRALAVLVAADRDVLRAVVLRDLAATQREHRGREGEQAGDQLLRGRAD